MKITSTVKVCAVIIFSAFALPVFGQCPASTFSLDTYYATNNGQRGCMFDITASQDITITCFDANLYSGTTADYEIYYKTGSFVGSESNAGAWTFLGGTTALTSGGNNVATNIPIPVNVYIASGQTCAFYVTNTFGGGTSYTDGSAANTILGSDANITIRGGVGKSYPYGLTFSFREFNGTAHYNLGTPLDVSLTSFDVTSTNRNVQLSWETATETNNDYFTLERSLDAVNWEKVQQIDGAGTSLETKQYSFEDKNIQSKMAYYRLSQTDFDGTQSNYSVRAVKIEETIPSSELAIGPNPSSDYAHVMVMPDEKGNVTVCTLSGQQIHVDYQESETGLILDVRNIDPGIYIVKVNENSGLLEVY